MNDLRKKLTAVVWVVTLIACGHGSDPKSSTADPANVVRQAQQAITSQVVTVMLPVGATLQTTILSTTEKLWIGSHATVGDGTTLYELGSFGEDATLVGESATVHGDISSIPPVLVEDGAHIDGAIRSASTINLGAGAVVAHGTTPNTQVSATPISWTVSLPSSNGGPVILYPGQSQTLAPGSFAGLKMAYHSTLTLHSGTYFFASLDADRYSTIHLDESGGPVIIYVTGKISLGATLTATAGTATGSTATNLLLVALGTSLVDIEGPLAGTLVAPKAEVKLGACGTHIGQVLAKAVWLDDHATITFGAFNWNLGAAGIVEPDGSVWFLGAAVVDAAGDHALMYRRGSDQHATPLAGINLSVSGGVLTLVDAAERSTTIKTLRDSLYVVNQGLLTSTYDGGQLRAFALVVHGGTQGFLLDDGTTVSDLVKEYAGQALDYVHQQLNDLADTKEAMFASELQQQVTDLVFKEDSDREEKRAAITAGGWYAVWGTEYDDAEYVKTGLAVALVVATDNPAPLELYFQDLISRNVDLLEQQFPEVGKQALEDYFTQALKDPGSNIGIKIANTGIEVKLGIATYDTTVTVVGQGTTNGLHHYQPYLAFRFTDPGTGNVIQPGGGVLGPPPIVSGDQIVGLDLYSILLVNKGAEAKSVIFSWGANFPLDSFTVAPGEVKALAQIPLAFDTRKVLPRVDTFWTRNVNGNWVSLAESQVTVGAPWTPKHYDGFSQKNDGRVLNSPPGSTIFNPFHPEVLAPAVDDPTQSYAPVWGI